jgi:hypothetical protein
MKPVRLRRSRVGGYNMQAESLAINGLPCVFVGRPTKFGNPFKIETFGLQVSLDLYRNTVHGIWAPALLSGHSQELRDLAHSAYMEFTDRFDVLATDAILDELRGKNLSCFCCLSHGCHADCLLEIANGGA